MAIIAYIIAALIPLVFLFVIYTLDLYKTGSFKFVLLCFFWGGLAVAAGYYVNVGVLKYHLVARENIIRFSAPIAEEILKGLILLYLVRRHDFTYFVDGAIYGFAAGIGFAIFENFFYIYSNPGSEFTLTIGRVISTNLVHGAASALVGVAVGMSRFKKLPGQVAYTLVGFLAAIALHSTFNNLVDRVQNGPILLYGAVIGFGGAGVIAYLIFRGLAEEKKWIEEKLGDADRVTRQEAGIVNRMADMGELLKPVEKFFGADKMPQVEKFLTLQARLGILRKTLDKLNDDKMVKAVSKQMDDLRLEMDGIRKSLGAYNMLHLRGILPSEASPLWNRMGDLINERAAARKGSGVEGPNLWASLGQRAAQTPKPAAEPASNPAASPAPSGPAPEKVNPFAAFKAINREATKEPQKDQPQTPTTPPKDS